MAFHFHSHPWEVQDREDGIEVTCTNKDVDAMTVPVLVDELFELVLESDGPNLYLDFAKVHNMASVVIGKLLALDNRLRKVGGRLILRNLDASLHEFLVAAHVAETFDLQVSEYQSA